MLGPQLLSDPHRPFLPAGTQELTKVGKVHQVVLELGPSLSPEHQDEAGIGLGELWMGMGTGQSCWGHRGCECPGALGWAALWPALPWESCPRQLLGAGWDFGKAVGRN